MPLDKFTEVTSQGLFGKLGESIKGVLVGVLLFIVAFPVLFWNEGRTVKTARDLESGAKTVISIKADPVDAANDKKLVHVTGKAVTTETLSDAEFGIEANAIKLIRTAEMYQWKEKSESKSKDKIGGGTETTTTYTYEKAWSDDLIKSSDFNHPEGHTNPAEMNYGSKTLTAQVVTLGAFSLTPGMVGRIDKTEPLAVTEETLNKLPRNARRDLSVSGGMYYFGRNPADPQIGDQKISFKLVKPTDISVVAQQTGNTFQPFKAEYTSHDMLDIGVLTADQMFTSAKESNTMFAWILRLVGFLMMTFGITMVFRPLTVTAGVIPFLGDMLGFGIGIFAAVVSAALSLLTIAIGWIVYRPLLGIPLLLVSVGLIVGLKVLASKKKAQTAV